MNLFSHRASSASPPPVEDDLDPRLQATLQQAYAAENVSPALHQRVSDMAAYHEQQTVMQKPLRLRVRFVIAVANVTGLLCLAYLITTRLFLGIYTIPSVSMEATLMGHDYGRAYDGAIYKETAHDSVLVNKWVYRWRNPQFGDIIMFLASREADPEHRFSGIQVENVLVERIIGLPGDTIEIKEGHVYRNGKQLNEYQNPQWSYSIKEPMDRNLEEQFHYGTRWRNHPLKLQEDEYWVMGDNRNDSNDSRYWGGLERSRIIGKVSLILAPFDRVRSFP